MILYFLLILGVELTLSYVKTKHNNKALIDYIRISLLILFMLFLRIFYVESFLNFRLFFLYTLIWLRLMRMALKSTSAKLKVSTFSKRLCLKQTLVLFFAFVPLFLFPVYTLSTTGSNQVSSHVKSYTDVTLVDPFNDTGGRTIQVAYWYPENLLENTPLIIFSHGGISYKESNKSLFLELASHGYIVASIDHTSHSIVTKPAYKNNVWINSTYLSDLLKENPRNDIQHSYSVYQAWMDVRTHDIQFLIETLENESNDSFYTLMDLNKIGVIGHSLGGSAALCMGRESYQVKLVVALESPFMCDIESINTDAFTFTDIPYPVPLLTVYTDSIYDKLDTLPQYAQNYTYLTEDTLHVTNLHLPGTGHFNLSDLALSSPILTRFLNGFKTHDNQSILHELNQAILLYINNHFNENE